jgi:NAD(P)-dependent dehydrogenase (short-subunit alcohol dehydrogenase family)
MINTNDQTPAPIALITGGSRGLGKSIALHLADRGVDVILTYRSAAKEARQVVAQIEAKGRMGAALPLDVAKSADFAAFAETVKIELQRHWKRDRLNFLVNNAGVALYASFAATTEAQFDEQVNVHFKATFFLSQRLLPLIADGGRIVNMSSGLARFSAPGYAAYGAVKGGIEVLTRYMAQELGPRRISVNVIAPGGIETDFGGGALRDNAELNKLVASQTALGRVGLPDDIGGAVAMLLAPESHWITGQRIEATGGYML